MEQKIEPRNKPTQCNQLIYDKETGIHNGKKSCFIKLCWENQIATCKRGKLHHFLTPKEKATQKGLNIIRSKTIKLLKEIRDTMPFENDLSNIF